MKLGRTVVTGFPPETTAGTAVVSLGGGGVAAGVAVLDSSFGGGASTLVSCAFAGFAAGSRSFIASLNGFSSELSRPSAVSSPECKRTREKNWLNEPPRLESIARRVARSLLERELGKPSVVTPRLRSLTTSFPSV